MNKSNQSLISILILLSSSLAFGWSHNEAFWGSSKNKLRGNLRVAERVFMIPKRIAEQFVGIDIRVFSVDLDSDRKLDYIVALTKEKQTCYVTSAFLKKHCEARGPNDGFSFYYFAQLDNDPMLELFDFSGHEDLSDFKLLKFDSVSWIPKPVAKVQPLLRPMDKAHKGIYWGYPWDITNLPLKKIDAAPALAIFDDKEKGLQILFGGIPTQGEAIGTFNDQAKKLKWSTLPKSL